MVANRQQNQNAAVRTLAANLPLVFKLVGVLRFVFPIQSLDGHYGDLRIRLGVVELGANAIQPGYRVRRKHVGKIAHVVCGLR